MGQVQLHVEVLDFPQDVLPLLYAACRQCYSSRFAGRIIEDDPRDDKEQGEFIKKVVASGHESFLEHAKLTFAIEGVSRVLTHQLVRHRIASYSQQSQRYVKESDFDYIIPPSVEEDEEIKREYIAAMERIRESYGLIMKSFEKKGRKGEAANEDARFVLPQAVETKIVATMNCRELLNFFRQRCCTRAQWEIRRLAQEMLKICKQRLPAVFENAGPRCVELGYCPEGEKFTCGRYPSKKGSGQKNVDKE
jgi:thymidylate synthase (FAD)